MDVISDGLLIILALVLFQQIESSPLGDIQVEIQPDRLSSDQSKRLKSTKETLQTLDSLLQSSEKLRKRLTEIVREHGLQNRIDGKIPSDVQQGSNGKEADSTVPISDNLVVATGNSAFSDTSESDKPELQHQDSIAQELESGRESVQPEEESATESEQEESSDESVVKPEQKQLDISQVIDQGKSFLH